MGTMEEEVSWEPPWDCAANEDDQINLSSPFRNSDPNAFRFVPVNGHPEFSTAKRQLHFNDDILSPDRNADGVEGSVNSEEMCKQKNTISQVKNATKTKK